VGLACAATLAVTALARGEQAHLAALRDRFERTAFAALPGLRPTVPIGDPEAAPPRAPHISSVFVPGLPAEPLLHALEARGVMASAGAACASRLRGPSHVLEAIGLDPRVAVLRFSLSRETTEGELDAAVVALEEAIAELERARPRRARR
jgi:cysteine desulfurase